MPPVELRPSKPIATPASTAAMTPETLGLEHTRRCEIFREPRAQGAGDVEFDQWVALRERSDDLREPCPAMIVRFADPELSKQSVGCHLSKDAV
ncbi:MAG: hypothetical protein AAFR79_11475 [Pseudomonadota bacterium]